jgi:acetylornithine/succinyldiaminopimelate/putrescine aminotransferase
MQTVTHRQLFFQHVAQTSNFPLALEIDRAEGIYLYDTTNNRTYIDLISGIGVSNVGHRHPAVLAAMHEQMDRYLHLMVYGEYVQSPQALLAKALADTLTACESPTGPLDNVYFTSSGAEAVEGAMKLAKRSTGRQEIISCFNAYHGSTQGALSLSGDENFKRNYRPLLPGIRHIRHGEPADLELISCRTAAVVIEVISAEAGVRVPDATYLQALRQRCTDVGALLIFDEIQTGFGRTGTFWAFEGFGPVVPDVLVAAKGMGGGMPIGAFIASARLMAVFKENPILGHITTFGGHPISCAASLATLNVIQAEKLHAQAEAKGQLIRQLLAHAAIRAIRGKGLLLAVEFDSFAVLKPIIDRAILGGESSGMPAAPGESTGTPARTGVITDWFLFCDNSMRIAPPLTISETQIREACAVILRAIDEAI